MSRTSAQGSAAKDRSELSRRIVVAVPVAAVLVAVVVASQTLLAALLLPFGCICFYEFCKLVRPEGRFGLAGLLGCMFYGLVWIGLPLALAVQLRGLHHGSWLVCDVLAAVVASDTGAYLGGKALGRHKLAPRISPNKTVEGWLIGLLTATAAVFLLGLLQSWLSTWQALVFGATVALISSAGDLFESYMKRRAGVKDSGTLFGAHGGALDRADAVLFGIVAGYALARLLGI